MPITVTRSDLIVLKRSAIHKDNIGPILPISDTVGITLWPFGYFVELKTCEFEKCSWDPNHNDHHHIIGTTKIYLGDRFDDNTIQAILESFLDDL